MKKIVINFTLVLILFSTISICNAQSIPPETEARLNNISREMTDAMLSNDFQATLKFYTDDVIIMPDFSETIRGKKSLKKQYNKDRDKGIRYRSFSGKAEKRWISGTEIFELGNFTMVVTSNNSSIPQAYYGSYFQIWEVGDNESFKIKYTIWNLDFNPFE